MSHVSSFAAVLSSLPANALCTPWLVKFARVTMGVGRPVALASFIEQLPAALGLWGARVAVWPCGCGRPAAICICPALAVFVPTGDCLPVWLPRVVEPVLESVLVQFCDEQGEVRAEMRSLSYRVAYILARSMESFGGEIRMQPFTPPTIEEMREKAAHDVHTAYSNMCTQEYDDMSTQALYEAMAAYRDLQEQIAELVAPVVAA